MSDPFVAEIRIFPFNFAPKGWAWCDGQIMNIAQNTALFSLLGTTYGGDGKITFALPNLQGRAPMHPGQGPGLSLHGLGESAGTEAVTLLASQIPSHSHGVQGSNAVADAQVPIGNFPARATKAQAYLAPTGVPLVAMDPQALAATGGGQPHNNMQPYLTFYFNIALQGIFPAHP